MDPVRVAIIGTGGISGSHVNAWKHVGNRVTPVAAVDIDAARVAAFADQHGIQTTYTNAGKMLAAERPDLVHICTPPAFHYPLIAQCLEAGAWVLCEKPLVASLEELDRIAELERTTGNSCVSVFQWRFGSAAQHIRQQIAQGTLGQSYVGFCNTTWYRDDAYYEVPWRGTWKSELGGVNMGQAIHLIDLMVWLMGGDWIEVLAVTDTLARDIEVEDTAAAVVRFANGALVTITSSVLAPRQESRVRLDFEHATVEVVGLYGYRNENWTVTPVEGAELPAGTWPPEADTVSSHGAQLAAVLNARAAGQKPTPSADDIRPTIELLTAIYKASVDRAPVLRGESAKDDRFYRHVGGHPG